MVRADGQRKGERVEDSGKDEQDEEDTVEQGELVVCDSELEDLETAEKEVVTVVEKKVVMMRIGCMNIDSICGKELVMPDKVVAFAKLIKCSQCLVVGVVEHHLDEEGFDWLSEALGDESEDARRWCSRWCRVGVEEGGGAMQD